MLVTCVSSSPLPGRGPSDCSYGLGILWTSSLRNAPITATPLLFDVDGDGYKDIVAPSVSGEVWAIHGENGHIVDNWPFYLEERGFHTSPLVVSLPVCTCTCLYGYAYVSVCPSPSACMYVCMYLCIGVVERNVYSPVNRLCTIILAHKSDYC